MAARSPSTDVREATIADAPAWDAFVAAHPEAAGYHEWAWRGVIERSFGHRGPYLIARDGDAVAGVLPLVEMKSPIFGHFLTSLPFVNYGGVLAATSDAADALVAAARDLGRQRGCRHVELRHVNRLFPDLPVRQHKVTMRLALGSGMWEGLDRKVRNQVRKAEKSGLVAERGGRELIPEFYDVFAHNMRDLGTPVCSRRLFEEVLASFGTRARTVVVRHDGRPVAGAVTYRTRTTTEVPWASSLRASNPMCPNHLMYWAAIQWAIEDGCTVFDFGRSTPGEGTYKFKAQWGAQPTPLHWEYPWLVDEVVPDQGPTNPRFRYAIAAWQRLPVSVTRALGPHLARALP